MSFPDHKKGAREKIASQASIASTAVSGVKGIAPTHHALLQTLPFHNLVPFVFASGLD
jgi:hypothetical protein